MEFYQISTDTSLEGERSDKISETFISFSRSHWHFETQILIEKCWCADYILNQWLEFKQTSTNDTLLGHGKEVILLTLTSFWKSLHYKDSKNEPFKKCVCTL